MRTVFELVFSPEAEGDLLRLFEHRLAQVQTVEDLDLAQAAIAAIREAAQHHLIHTPFSFRKAGSSPTRRELIVPFGRSGYVLLFEIEAPARVVVLAVRHQLEADYH